MLIARRSLYKYCALSQSRRYSRFEGQVPTFAVGAHQLAKFLGCLGRPVCDVILRHGRALIKISCNKNMYFKRKRLVNHVLAQQFLI